MVLCVQNDLILHGVNMRYEFFVKCSECGEEHTTDELKFVDVAEDQEGRDVGYFVCPATGETTKSLVYKK